MDEKDGINVSIKRGSLFLMALLSVGILLANSTWDSERIDLESRIQKRVEESLVRIIPRSKFLVVVKVEPWEKPLNNQSSDSGEDSQFFLPGVPLRPGVDGPNAVEKIVENMNANPAVFKRFIRRISTTLVVDEGIEDNIVEQVRELTRQMVGLNAERGDTLEVQKTRFYEKVIEIDNSSLSRFQRSIQNYWLIISLSLIVLCVTIFFLFIFGPLRGFLNKFVKILPSLKARERESNAMDLQNLQSMLPGIIAQQMGGMLPGQQNASGSNFSGSLNVENPNKVNTPFGFIREDHLSNLAILLSRETPDKAAVVLGYLPAEWISRVLTRMNPEVQSQITSQLADTKQLLPEQVEDIEQDLKRRLDYLVGGPDRLVAIYESLDTEGQMKMLDNLRDVRPELADELRKKSILFEDLDKLDENSLKTLLRDIDLQTLVSALQGTKEEFIDQLLKHVSAGKAEIVREELELNRAPAGRITKEAQKKITMIARKLEKEGQLQVPEVHESSDGTFGPGRPLKDVIKLPPGLSLEESEFEEAEVSDESDSGPRSLNSKLKDFMKKSFSDSERYPLDDADEQ